MILPTKVCLVKAVVFPVVMYGCESWTIKKAECWRIDAFELWCWRGLLRVPWKDWCWSWNSNTLATRCEELTHLKRPWCWERLKAGGEGDDRRWDGWMASPTPGAFSNSCPLSLWCHPTTSSSVVPFSSCHRSFPASGSFPRSQFFTSGGQSIVVSALALILLMNIQD